jgi:hypothetical protein
MEGCVRSMILIAMHWSREEEESGRHGCCRLPVQLIFFTSNWHESDIKSGVSKLY